MRTEDINQQTYLNMKKKINCVHYEKGVTLYKVCILKKNYNR